MKTLVVMLCFLSGFLGNWGTHIHAIGIPALSISQSFNTTSIDLLIEQEITNIQKLSSQIENTNFTDLMENLTLHAERGLRYFFLGQYNFALEDFDYILDFLYRERMSEKSLFGTALWGRLFCHAYMGQDDKAFEDLFVTQAYFKQAHSNCASNDCRVLLNEGIDSYYMLPIAKFADPNEQISPEECKSRVKGIADVMRIIAMKIPNQNLASLVNFSISELEYFSSGCCDRNRWTDCLGPVADAWHYMKDCMDKGAAIAPRIIYQGR